MTVGGENGHAVGVGAEAGSLVTQRIEDDSVQVFALEFTECILLLVRRLQRKANEPLVGTFALAQRTGYIRRGAQR